MNSTLAKILLIAAAVGWLLLALVGLGIALPAVLVTIAAIVAGLGTLIAAIVLYVGKEITNMAALAFIIAAVLGLILLLASAARRVPARRQPGARPRRALRSRPHRDGRALPSPRTPLVQHHRSGRSMATGQSVVLHGLAGVDPLDRPGLACARSRPPRSRRLVTSGSWRRVKCSPATGMRDALHQPLAGRDRRPAAADVVEQQQSPARHQHPPHLADRARRVGERAQPEGA